MSSIRQVTPDPEFPEVEVPIRTADDSYEDVKTMYVKRIRAARKRKERERKEREKRERRAREAQEAKKKAEEEAARKRAAEEKLRRQRMAKTPATVDGEWEVGWEAPANGEWEVGWEAPANGEWEVSWEAPANGEWEVSWEATVNDGEWEVSWEATVNDGEWEVSREAVEKQKRNPTNVDATQGTLLPLGERCNNCRKGKGWPCKVGPKHSVGHTCNTCAHRKKKCFWGGEGNVEPTTHKRKRTEEVEDTEDLSDSEYREPGPSKTTRRSSLSSSSSALLLSTNMIVEALGGIQTMLGEIRDAQQHQNHLMEQQLKLERKKTWKM